MFEKYRSPGHPTEPPSGPGGSILNRLGEGCPISRWRLEPHAPISHKAGWRAEGLHVVVTWPQHPGTLLR